MSLLPAMFTRRRAAAGWREAAGNVDAANDDDDAVTITIAPPISLDALEADIVAKRNRLVTAQADYQRMIMTAQDAIRQAEQDLAAARARLIEALAERRLIERWPANPEPRR